MPLPRWIHYQILFKRLLLLILLFQLSRIIFGVTNPSTVSSDYLLIFLAGLRYDITVICILNLPVVLMHVYPSKFSFSKAYQKTISILLIAINALALLLNYIDAGWFPFNQKRSTFDFFTLISTGDDLQNNLGTYLLDFWYLALLWVLSVITLSNFEKKFRKSISSISNKHEFLPTHLRIGLAVLLLLFGVIGFRGGMQLKPLSIQAAAKMVPSNSIPLVLNTPYTLLKSRDDQLLKEPSFIPLNEAKKIFNIHQQLNSDSTFNNKNVVLIIMESFSYDYISYYHPEKSTTPFFDSLMRVSDTWPNCFANAKRSIEGIPAVVSSMPSLMDQSFINSAYNVAKINSLASILKPFGYTSAFFHGGNNGTMGFDNFTKLAGYEKYFGKKEYDGPAEDYDGHWGIFDDKYFSFMIRKINQWKTPFHAAFFSVSSHHPYTIPSDFKNKIPKGLSPVEQGMAYADASLRAFFHLAKKQSWYNETIFIITSDHSGPATTPYTSNRIGAYHIPLLFVNPQSANAKTHLEIAQQTDILPSVLHLLNYNGKYSSFGRNLYESSEGWSINYSNQTWQLITDKRTLQFDGINTTHYYLRQDSLMQFDLMKTSFPSADTSSLLLRAILQQYQFGLIHNQLLQP
jgi:phosphoglycerol transferase MdoB-like AlkP superfamily enzyme